MKVWMFYYKADPKDIIRDYIENQELTIEEKYPLYAITNDKVLAHSFMDTRNMKSFIVKTAKVDFEDYKDYVRSAQDAVLEMFSLETKDEYNFKVEVDVTCTKYEYYTITDMDIELLNFDEDFWSGIPIYSVFNKKCIEALKTMGFTAFYKMMATNPIIPEEDDDYSSGGVSIDQVELLLTYFKGTFI